MCSRSLGCGLVLVLASLGMPARGEVFVQTVTFPAEVMVPDTTGGKFLETYTALFRQFNPAVGTLNSVQFDLGFGYQIVLTGDPMDGGAGGGSVSGIVYLNQRPDGYIGGGNGGGGGIGPGMEFVIPIPQNYTQTSVPGGPNPGDTFFNEFTGTDEVVFQYDATADLTPNPGTMRVELTDSPPATITLTYDYTPAALSNGDYNGDGVVDAGDYIVWRNNLGEDLLLPGDVTPGSVTADDYEVWKQNYGAGSSGLAVGRPTAVPEPSTGLLVVAALVVAQVASHWRRRGEGCLKPG